MLQRRCTKQTIPLKDRLAAFAAEAREQASLLPPCAEKHELLMKARRAETASHLGDWANSPGLQPPRR
jgi:hypothetical protein